MDKWKEKIMEAESLKELDKIIEDSALDETITNAEYCELYSMALVRARTI